MITLEPWKEKSMKIEHFNPEGRGYEKDRWGLLNMEVGDSTFWVMVPNNRISPYTSNLHKTTKRKYLVLKHRHEDLDGTLVVRLPDRKGGASEQQQQ